MATLNYFNVLDLPGNDWQVEYSITDDDGNTTSFQTPIFDNGPEALAWAQEELDSTDTEIARLQQRIAEFTTRLSFKQTLSAAITAAMAPYI